MASSSSSPQENHPFTGLQPNNKIKSLALSPKLYDVFINHRGPDMKKILVHSLYNRLKDLGKVFLDSLELELGEWFPSSIENAIASSWLHIAVFSKRYAESPWCLAELVFMLKTNVKLIPVFYDVEPWELRYIEQGKGSYADAFATYQEKGRYLDRLQDWNDALRNASFITGLDFTQYQGNNEKLWEDIVREVLKEKGKRIFLKVAESPVGLDKLVKEFEMLCKQKEDGKATVVGIFGMGGSGKTTLVKQLFNRRKAEYDASTFLFDVREASVRGELPSLQAKLLKDLVNEVRPEFQSVDEGMSYLMDCLGRGDCFRFLIVVDDINHKNQLNALVPRDIFNPDSLIIVTTRDESVLREAAITLRYKMKVMNTDNSRMLFCWAAFRQPVPASGYEDLVEGFVEACGGLPLSLQLIGGNVFGTTDKNLWQQELDKFRQTLDGDIKKSLQISFDGLESHEKQIFMDIACFFIGSETPAAIKIWKKLGWSAEHAIRKLKDKCLIEEKRYTTNEYFVFKKRSPCAELAFGMLKEKLIGTYPTDGNCENFVLGMHDHLRDLGREMAEKFRPLRLWRPEILESWASKGFKYILSQVNGRSVRCIHSILQSTTAAKITYVLGNLADCSGPSTALLYLELEDCRCTSIPSWIPLRNLQYLRIHSGNLKSLWKSYKQAPLQLKELELLADYNLCNQVSNELGMFVELEYLALQGHASNKLQNGRSFLNPKLRSLIVPFADLIGKSKIEGRFFSDSLRKLTKLKGLSLSSLYLNEGLDLSNSGESVPSESHTSNLQTINFNRVGALSKILISGNHCPSLQTLELLDMEDLTELDLPRVTSLERLSLRGCHRLKRISGNFDQSKLVTVEIRDCLELEEMPNLGRLHFLRRITIDDGRNLHNTLNIPHLQCLESVIINLCPKLSDVTGIEDLEGLKCLHIFAGNRAVRNCIADLKRLPSEVTCVMARAYDGIEATLNASFFRDVMDNARGQICIDENVIPHDFWDEVSKMARITIPQYLFQRKLVTMRQYSTSIVCGVVESSSWVTFNWSSKKGKDISYYRHVPFESLIDNRNYFDGISGRIPSGRWMFIIVNTGQIQLELLCPFEPVSVIKKLCKVTVYGKHPSRVLSMLRRIVCATVLENEKWDVIDY